MNKKLKLCSALLAAVTACGVLAGCKGKKTKVDVTGTIIIEPFANSSFGISWIEKMAAFRNAIRKYGSIEYRYLFRRGMYVQYGFL